MIACDACAKEDIAMPSAYKVDDLDLCPKHHVLYLAAVQLARSIFLSKQLYNADRCVEFIQRMRGVNIKEKR